MFSTSHLPLRPDPVLTSETSIAGVAAVCDPSGGLYLPDCRTLVVSDLHLERGSAFARLGMMLPPYDTIAKISLVEEVVGRYAPKRLVSLGDSFHDRRGSELMAAAYRERLARLASSLDTVWVDGNHDPDGVVGLPGTRAAEVDISGLRFRHQADPTFVYGEVSGHFHPSATVIRRGTRVRRPCFASDGIRMVMPAFGTIAGGLDLDHRAMSGLFDRGTLVAHVVGTGRVYPVPYTRLKA